MTTIKSIISFLVRKIKTYTINMLEMFSYNMYYYWATIAIYLLTSIFSSSFSNIIQIVILVSWVVGWLYQLIKQEFINAELEEQVKELQQEVKELQANVLDYDILVESLAPIMHDIWSKDVLGLTSSTQEELNRANTPYAALSDNDKEHNRLKARTIIDWFDEQ